MNLRLLIALIVTCFAIMLIPHSLAGKSEVTLPAKAIGSLIFADQADGGQCLRLSRGHIGEMQSTQTSPLQVGKPVQMNLRAGETHTYTINLPIGQYVHVIVDQEGIDVVVTLVAVDGTKLLNVDSPNGSQGPEPLFFTSETAGVYRIQVSSLEKDAAPGRYEIKLVELRPATSEDKQRILNARKQAENQKLEGEVVVEIRPLLVEGERLNLAGNFDAAIPLVKRALAISEEKLGPNHKIVGACLNNLGELYAEKKEFEQAESLYLRALPLLEQGFGSQHVKVAVLLSNIGTIYYERGDFATAKPFLQRSADIANKIFPPDPATVTILNNLAQLYEDAGDYISAEPLYLRAIEISEKTLSFENVNGINLIGNIGVHYLNKGDYQKGDEYLQRGLKIAEKVLGAEHPLVAVFLNNLGHLHYTLHDFTNAEGYFKRSLTILQSSKTNPNTALVLSNLADIRRVSADPQGAEKLYQQSIDILVSVLGPEHPDIAGRLNNLASLYEENGQLDKAEKAYQSALTMLRKVRGPKHPDVALVLSNLATMYLRNGDLLRALEYAKESFEIREYNFGLVLATGSEKEKRLFMSVYYPEIEGAVSFHMKSAPKNLQAARLALTIVLQRKGRILDIVADQLAVLRERLSSEDQAILDQLTGLRSQFASLVLKGLGDGDLSDYKERLTNLEAEIERIESSLSRRSAAVGAQAEPITIESIQKLIPADMALVEFVWYEPYDPEAKILESYGNPRYAAYVLKHNGEPSWVDLGDATVINREIAKLRASLRSPEVADDTTSLARTVEEHVMRPVRSLLGDSHKVLLSPDNALNPLPFGALVDEQGHFLIEKYSFTYLTSGRDLLRLQSNFAAQGPALVMADPLFDLESTNGPNAKPVAPNRTSSRSRDFDGSFAPLNGTVGEGNEIARMLAVKPLLGANATEGKLKSVHGPNILHVATHGFFLSDQKRQDPDPSRMKSLRDNSVSLLGLGEQESSLLRSGIALAGANRLEGGDGEDGILTAFEASGLDLHGTKLVVLSACETGIGDIQNAEGIYGLRRALVLAGSESQIISLWKVRDDVTKDLMINYYRRLQQGEGRSEALRNVQLDMIKNKSRRHPYFWAGFIESGNWKPLELRR